MSDGITDGRREADRMFKEWREQEIQKFLSNLSTKELLDELVKREGIKEHIVEPYSGYHIVVCHDTVARDTGAARILVVKL
jgi:hypothetical protein